MGTPPMSREGRTYTGPSGPSLNMDYLDYIPSYPTTQLNRVKFSTFCLCIKKKERQTERKETRLI